MNHTQHTYIRNFPAQINRERRSEHAKTQKIPAVQRAMNWSMTNAQVLEQEGEQARPAPEVEEEA
eukprot:5904941-Heterocapsa_arctica.AAC.1